MKKSNNAGFSLTEILVAIAIFALTVVPLCGSMVLATRINAKAEATLQAQMAVSSVVETLKANGYNGTSTEIPYIDHEGNKIATVKISNNGDTLTIQDENELVTVVVNLGG